MHEAQDLSVLRASGWATLPSCSGIYWWYFPAAAIDQLRISAYCDLNRLNLRTAPNGDVCLYHGMANDLAQRVKWHAAQSLTPGCLKSGFLSTFRFTLLALMDYDYPDAQVQIDGYFDTLSVAWRATGSREEAQSREEAELNGGYHFPLNIRGNRRPELRNFLRHLVFTRKAYKQRHLRQLPNMSAPPGRPIGGDA